MLGEADPKELAVTTIDRETRNEILVKLKDEDKMEDLNELLFSPNKRSLDRRKDLVLEYFKNKRINLEEI